ncbi:MAG: flagellar M-ring protein FliF [Alicyclobacillus sp.]|nr:flagellar M-ring protein FliF [Alicyclobacillus sp.]
MNETLQAWWVRLKQTYGALSPSQRRNIGIALVAGVFCLVVILWMLARPNYVTIMTGLDNKSLGQVQAQLETLKIPSEIEGTSVLVPRKDADTARVQLAMAGLPSTGTIDYGSITSSFGMTQDQFNIQVLNVLQESLAQTIQSMNGIESANVHIVMPTNSVFVSQPTDSAKAAVFVQLGPGVQLSSAQVYGIQQLVSHSVTGLAASDVAVVDQNGNTLSSPGTSLPAGTTSNSELAMRTELENQVQQQLLSGLESIVGPGNAVVVVHANVTFNQVETKSHVYVPLPGQSTGMIASQQKVSKTSSNGSASGAGGLAGQSASNPGLSTYAGVGAGNGASSSTDNESSTTYDNSYKDSTVIADPMQVNGFSVGVLLNSANKAFTPAVVRQIKAWVANSVGLQGGTTNNVTVVPIPFQTTPVQGAASSVSVPAWAGLAALALLLAGGGAVIVVRRRRRIASEQSAANLKQPSFEGLELESLPPTEDEFVREQLVRLANQRPEEFANLLRTWLLNDS